MLPPLALHVTRESEVPDTLLVNCTPFPEVTLALPGLSVTLIGYCRVTCAVALFVESAALVAVTVTTLDCGIEEGAV